MYSELVRTVRKYIRGAKKNYEIKVAREAKSDLEGSFQLHQTKTRTSFGTLKTANGETMVSKA